MSEPLRIQQVIHDDSQYQFEVTVGQRRFTVTVHAAYHQKLTNGAIPAEELVRLSFEFLLEREPASSILPAFDLPLIGRYFPEYEESIKQML